MTIPGEGLGFVSTLYSSFLVLLPVSLCHGALFTYGCKLYSQYAKERASSIGNVYILETIGTLSGGLLITFLLIQSLNSFEIVFIISLMNSLISLLLLWPGRRTASIQLHPLLWRASVILSLLFACSLIPPYPTFSIFLLSNSSGGAWTSSTPRTQSMATSP